jgi:glutathionylspermidine synthase
MPVGALLEPLRPVVTATPPWVEHPPLDASTHREVRAAAIFECCKWDPQVGDTDVLSRTPLVLRTAAWDDISTLAETLYAETLRAEAAILKTPRALADLGLPASLVRTLRKGELTPAPFRVMRFDFHATTEGWRISEVNSDVPGGFIEASGFTRLMAAHTPGCRPAGDPTAELRDRCLQHLPAGARIGLVHATAYTDDRQVMIYLKRALEGAGFQALLSGPDTVRWQAGHAQIHDGSSWQRLDAIFRFYPTEWLPNLGWRSSWKRFVRQSITPAINPPASLISQSKRFPLAGRSLGLSLPTWDALLPETRDPRDCDDAPTQWVLKPALGRVGEDIGIAGVTDTAALIRIRRNARRHPHLWAAQRRFEALPWLTADGPRFPCIGVYVIGGRAAGAYGRVCARPLIDSHAQDVAVLVTD